MRRLLLLLLAVSATTFLLAQDEDPKNLSAASKHYREYRMYMSEPHYGLSKIKHIITKLDKRDPEEAVMSPKAFSALPTKEKFTYCMMHAEIFDQNCNGMPGVLGEEKKMFAFPTEPFYGQMKFSPQQLGFLHKRRSEVLKLIRATYRSNHRVGCNLKAAIIELDAWELIPSLISEYNRNHKDHDILTTFCVLMKNAKYGPFLKTGIYQKLYGNPDTSYKSFVTVTPASRQLCDKWAMDYCRSQKG